ncbi:hypothetical protein [Telluria aromaticivorans]|uniref:hypothetical protein n=1 Tax=Telluria aromaticivorans TaxID=2725995 RepID=UPI001BB2A6BD|nr:hypothetical protein [Telluria aromaticivorans]
MAQKRLFLEPLAAIAWSFVGLRRKKDFDVDAEGTSIRFMSSSPQRWQWPFSSAP